MSGIAIFRRAEEVRHWCRREKMRTAYPRIYSASDEAALECERRALKYETLDDFHALEDVARITRCAHELSLWWERDWVRDRYPELQTFHGVSIGPVLELPIYHVCAEAVRSVLIAKRLIDTARPSSILVGEQLVHRGGFWVGFRLNLKVDAICLVAEHRAISIKRMRATNFPAKGITPVAKILKRLLRTPGRARRWLAALRGIAATTGVLNFDLSASRRRVLVYAEGRHAETLGPLIKEMQSDPQFHVVTLTQDMSESCQREIAAAGGPLFDAEGRFGADARVHAQRIASEVRERWEKSPLAHDLQQFGERRLGMSIWTLVRFQFTWLFSQGIGEVFRRTLIAEDALRAIEPNLLLTPVDSSVNDLCWILAAKAQGIPTLTQLHGAVYVRPTGYIWGRSFSDRLAVWGPMMRQWYVEETARPPGQFACVGYPYFEGYRQRYEKLDRSAILRRIGLEDRRPVILFLVSMTGGAVASYYRSQRKVYASFLESLQTVPNAQAVIRTHPASDPSLPRYLADANSIRCLLNPPITLMELLKVSDVVVGQPTTALIEAMLVKKPVIFFSEQMAEDLMWWLQHGNLRRASTSPELAALLARVLGDNEERARMIRDEDGFLPKVTGPIDGLAGRRTIDLAKGMMGVSNVETFHQVSGRNSDSKGLQGA